MNENHYRNLSDSEILTRLEQRASEERTIQVEVLRLLREVERRKLYADLGYSSTFKYCVKHLKYSEGSASRRISAMFLLSDLPQGESTLRQLKEGRVNLTALGSGSAFH